MRFASSRPMAPQHPGSDDPHAYIGECFDPEAGLISAGKTVPRTVLPASLNARYYDPKLAMFLQPDWREVTQPGVGTNRYAYAGGDPVKGSEPGGMSLSRPPSPSKAHDGKGCSLEPHPTGYSPGVRKPPGTKTR